MADVLDQMAEFQRYCGAVHLHLTWSGEAAAAHAEAHRHWARGEAMMRQALAQLHKVGDTAHANYTAVMAASRDMWS